MAEILCGVMDGSESSGKVCENSTSRMARRRSRMDVRRFGVVSTSGMVDELAKKRQRLWRDGDDCVDLETGDKKEDHVVGFNRCPGYGMTSVCGRRKDMEDRVSIKLDFLHRCSRSNLLPGGFHFFGVFDGHGCSHVATKCKDRMHEVMAEEMEATVGYGKGDCDNFVEWTSVMETSFYRVDAETMSLGGDGSCKCALKTSNHVGSTAVVAVVSSNHLIVSNCGDSRAVLSRGGVAVPLSSDHKPDRADELKRIEDAGGRVIYWDGARVLGVLAMSRAIGDHHLKPYVTAEPEVSVIERRDKDEFLILASDGLWDVVSNSTACEVVRMCLRSSSSGGAEPDPELGPVVDDEGDSGKDKQGGSEKACVDAAVMLTKLAIARRSADNVSVVVVDLRQTKVRRNSCSRRA